MDSHGGSSVASALACKLCLPENPTSGQKGVHTKNTSRLEAYEHLAGAVARKSPNVPYDRPIPSGVTYLAQMMAHDLILTVPTGDNKRPFDNLISRPFMLDSLYGLGPSAAPHLYMHTGLRQLRIKFAEAHIEPKPCLKTLGPELGRSPVSIDQVSTGESILADRRNDSHTIIAQITAVWMRFHNRVVDRLADGSSSFEARQLRFVAAQNIVRTTWHNVLLKDVLPFILTDEEMCKDWQLNGLSKPPVPSGAARIAFRTLHALPLPVYQFNDFGGENLSLAEMVKIGSELDQSRPDANWQIDWQKFFDIEGNEAVNRTEYEPKFASNLLDRDKKELFLADLARSMRIKQLGSQDKRADDLIKTITPNDVPPEIESALRLTLNDDDKFKSVMKILGKRGLPLQIILLMEAKQPEYYGKTLGAVGSDLLAPWLMGALCWAKDRVHLTDDQNNLVKTDFEGVLADVGLI